MRQRCSDHVLYVGMFDSRVEVRQPEESVAGQLWRGYGVVLSCLFSGTVSGSQSRQTQYRRLSISYTGRIGAEYYHGIK